MLFKAKRLRKLIETIEQTRVLVAAPGNEFIYCGWLGYDDALTEIDMHLEKLRRDDLSELSALRVLFAPTGPLQDLSAESGWSEEYLALSSVFDSEAAKFP